MGEQENISLQVLIAIHKMESFLRIQENDILKNYQITPMQLGVLDTIFCNGCLKIQDLIDQMSSTSGNMTVVIRNLERYGYISRETVPEDKRCCLIQLTETGERILQEIMPIHRQNINTVLKGMPEENQRMLINMIADFLNHINKG